MAEHFYDTSAAVKHYRAELGTLKVDNLLADAASRHYLSTLGVLEIHSAFARLVRTGQITAVDNHRLRARLLNDIAAGQWQVVQVTAADFLEAQLLLVKHATTIALRTLDALQLATALSLNRIVAIDSFQCSDPNLCLAATAEGLRAVNPEIP